MDPANSTLTFTLRHIVVQEIQGQFHRWVAASRSIATSPSCRKWSIWVDLASIDTGSAERDDQVRSPEFLDVGRFPRATFKGTSVAPSDERIRVAGALELHGIRHRVELEVTLGPVTQDGDVARASYSPREHRSAGLRAALEPGSRRGGVVVGDRVELRARVEAIRVPDDFIRRSRRAAAEGGGMSLRAFAPPDLPPGLEPLADLALDLRWIWSHQADHLWRRIDPETWEATRNPWLILQEASRDRLAALAIDPTFTAELGRLLESRQRYLATRFDGAPLARPSRTSAWNMASATRFRSTPGASAWQGDQLEGASDLGVPMVASGSSTRRGISTSSSTPAGARRALSLQRTGRAPDPAEPRPVGRVAEEPLDLPGRRCGCARGRRRLGA